MAAATDAVTTKMEEKTTSGMEAKFSAFPFKPYGIQLDFMKALYSSLDKGGVAMLESPTGTGKTLSIICSALQWIVDRKQLLKSEAGGVSGRNGTTGDQPLSDDEPDWMRSFVPVSERKDQKREKAKKLGHRSWGFDKRRPKKDCRDLFSGSGKEEEDVGNQKGPVMPQKTRDTVELNEDEFLLEEYESEDEGKDDGNPKRKANSVSFSSSSDGEDEDGLRDEEEEEDLKVYFCSRTHSQLSQFIKELRRTTFASELKVISLGSRKNLCINEEVHKLGNSTRISERCLDLQKHRKEEFSKTKIEGNGRRIQRKKSSSGCPMLRKHKLQRQFMNEVTQLEALDIEDLVHLGKRIGTCPYYGSRSVVPVVSLVVLPYQSLLFKSSRESLGLNLKNSIVIIDEAHNLADCLTSMFDSKITLSQLEQVHSHLELYFERFRKLLGAGNRRYIQTLMVITRAFLRVFLDDKNSSILSSCQGIEHDPGEKNVCDSSMAINEFLFSLNVDNINLVKLMLYIKESKIIHKVNGYGAKLASIQGGSMIDDGGGKENALSGFQALVDVLSSLTNNDGDGRIIISRRRDICSSKQEGYIKYVMLAGEKIFSEIEELGRLLCNLVTVVPEGIVVFFSSFEYEGLAHDTWKASGILARIMKKKRIFREPRSNADVELVLKEYKETILALSAGGPKENPVIYNGAMLLAVVGGKVSEGINFSDGMGRCVVMVGLPYANPSDVELMERIKHIEGLGESNNSRTPVISTNNESCNGEAVQAGFGILRSCKRQGREYYENLCMKAVNQSIGRAIRHINDYAAILLVDSRYASDPSKRCFSHPTSKLPQWIKDRLISTTSNYGEVQRLLRQFFKFNKERKQKI
ncbi:ATP-dependent DNA helicase DDX11 isoform X3 [Macadamia integrifolia]|uniref:ATP-dependent DNA helicase DDX11 isoform X3 n=1 Tax=Macadamia integrifolia TaxID=60698 RepID=UPI001C52ACA2|nr:ATP-dependent DNA helicase DDX11 isoform X3 [Macadamia integrifolia]